MVAKLGQDAHNRGAKIIALAFGDIGFNVSAVFGPGTNIRDEARAVLDLLEGKDGMLEVCSLPPLG